MSIKHNALKPLYTVNDWLSGYVLPLNVSWAGGGQPGAKRETSTQKLMLPISVDSVLAFCMGSVSGLCLALEPWV